MNRAGKIISDLTYFAYFFQPLHSRRCYRAFLAKTIQFKNYFLLQLELCLLFSNSCIVLYAVLSLSRNTVITILNKMSHLVVCCAAVTMYRMVFLSILHQLQIPQTSVYQSVVWPLKWERTDFIDHPVISGNITPYACWRLPFCIFNSPTIFFQSVIWNSSDVYQLITYYFHFNLYQITQLLPGN